MIGLDTNVLARYYVADESDAEAARQHKAAARLVDSGEPLLVVKTGFICFMSKKKSEGCQRRLRWPRDRFAAGMRIKLKEVFFESTKGRQRNASLHRSRCDPEGKLIEIASDSLA